MNKEYKLGKIQYNTLHERDEQLVTVTVHCKFGPFNYLTWVWPQFAQSPQGEKMIAEWAMEAWRNEYEKKRQELKRE